ncbi:MAG TPA: cytochrome c oxidase subunit II [Dongiaceae bacterium]|nr:cytochrome c oxidase subunit II [Dongiaceae bacterium]
MKKIFSWLAMAGASLAAFPAWAADGPQPWEIDLQPPATSIARELVRLNNGLNWLIFAVAILVAVLLVFIIFRFNERVNKTPSQRSHNTVLEIVWTAIPALILLFVAIPSFRLLYNQLDIPATELTVKVTGHQWYWSYEFPDAKFGFDSNIVQDKDLKPGQLRLLEVDNPLVLPVGTSIKVQITAADVIHSWSMPAFGVKHDAVPGKINVSWFTIDHEGTFYGQCQQLCGTGHAYMPIKIVAVSKEKFQQWLGDAKKKFAANTVPGVTRLANAGQ